MPDAKLLTPPQVAQRHGCKPETVRSWIRSGRLKALQTSGGKRPRFRIRPEDLDEFERGIEFMPAAKTERRRRRKQADDFIRYY